MEATHPQSEPLISAEEVDALLAPGGGSKVRAYELGGQQRITRGRLPALENALEEFARVFRGTLVGLLKREPQLQFQGLQSVKQGDWAAGIAQPGCLAPLSLAPLPGQGLWQADLMLMSRLVDAYFGGPGKPMLRSADRGLTPTEARFALLFFQQASLQLQQALQPVQALQATVAPLQSSLSLVPVAAPAESVWVAGFHLELATGGGTFQLVLPAALLEPLRERLNTPPVNAPRAAAVVGWAEALGEGLAQAPCEARVVLSETRISLGDLLRLKAGDIVPIDPPRAATLQVGDVPLFTGRFGVSRGHHSLKIEAMVRRPGPANWPA
jgi:flagellar motor switch protein FliM